MKGLLILKVPPPCAGQDAFCSRGCSCRGLKFKVSSLLSECGTCNSHPALLVSAVLLAPSSLSVFLALSLFLSLDLAVLVRSGLVKGKVGSCEVIPGTWHEGSCVPVASVLLGLGDNAESRRVHVLPGCHPQEAPEAFAFSPAGGESSLVGLGRPTSRSATSVLSLGERMPWLQATAGHSPDSDQSHRKTCVMGDAEESVQGEERGVGPTGRPLGWAILVSRWP